ncbi:hypothetical protein O181_043048 [Austropuccinia psidii MF-1]|uniref:Uncharacterized protein n=1 Tax=Austropuccinia psidii MF-1 TaxID=1389203 RepID=A0A9Q3HFB4_9BASI|nr:hypothetical protein [Austropuccinia psidii MF-1]
MSTAYLRDLGSQRIQPKDREGLSRGRRPGRGHLGHSGGWKNTEGNHTHTTIHIPIQQEPQTRGLEDMDQVLQLHQLLKDLFQWSMDNKKFNLASHWEELGASFQKACLKEIDFKDLMIITKALQWLQTIQKPTDKWPRVTILHTPRRVPGEDKDTRARTRPLFTKGKRVRPNDPETVGICERSTQEAEVVLNHSRISSPLNRNITPTQIEHNAVSPESNLNSDALWLQMSQYAEKTQKQFAELEASH